MPTPRKHVSHLGENTRKRNVGRYKDRELEAKPTIPLGPAPKHLTPAEKAIWAELVRVIPAGILFACDIFIVELCVMLSVKMRERRLSSTEVAQYRACLASLGASPADRSRVKAPPPPPAKSALDRILDGDDEDEQQLATREIQ